MLRIDGARFSLHGLLPLAHWDDGHNYSTIGVCHVHHQYDDHGRV